MDINLSLSRRMFAEFIGTALLLVVVVGSGIQAQRLTGDVALQLLANSTTTGFGLVVIITMLGPLSGAHLNPVVTIADAIYGRKPAHVAGGYVAAQIIGAIAGTTLANFMFGLGAVSISTKDRASTGHFTSEVLATAGLLVVIFAILRSNQERLVAPIVGSYIASAYWFTSSTSFANPAVTIARMFSNTFAGISPGSVPSFVLAQLVGLVAAVAVIGALYPLAPSQDARYAESTSIDSISKGTP